MSKTMWGGLEVHATFTAKQGPHETILALVDGGLLVVSRKGGNVVINPRTQAVKLTIVDEGFNPPWFLTMGLVGGLIEWAFRSSLAKKGKGLATGTVDVGEAGVWEIAATHENMQLLKKVLEKLAPAAV